MAHKHHLLFPRVAWDSHEATKSLRRDKGLIIPMEEEAHKRLHATLAIVPILDRFTAWRVSKHYEQGEEPMDSVHNFMFALDHALSDKRTDRIARANGAVVMQAIGAQLPYIHEGLIV